MNNRVVYIGLGMVIGGIGGYLLADLIAWKILEKEFEEKLLEAEEEVGEDLFIGLREHMDGQREDKRIDYSKYTKPDLKEVAQQYETVEEGPVIISLDTWTSDDVEEFDREVITYYGKDGVFADEAENQLSDPNTLFGPNIHLHFGEESDDPDVVYVLNASEGAVFEIVRIHESYAVQVLGEEPPKKRGRPRKTPVESKSDED